MDLFYNSLIQVDFMINAIETNRLCKSMGKKEIVKSIDFTVPTGKIYGLVGKNGAGKTTLMKLICGIIMPTSGELKLFNSSNLNVERKETGCLIEQPALYPNMTAAENLAAQGCLLRNFNKNEIPEVLEKVGLSFNEKKKVKSYSMGMKQRLGIALALLGKPRLLVLDEPMNGLDPIGIKQMRKLICDLNNEYNMTIVLSSHIIDELAKMVHIYGIMKDGHLIKEIETDELEEEMKGGMKIQVLQKDVEKTQCVLQQMNFFEYQYKEGYFILNICKEKELNMLLKEFATHDITIVQLVKNEYQIEDYVISFLEGSNK